MMNESENLARLFRQTSPPLEEFISTSEPTPTTVNPFIHEDSLPTSPLEPQWQPPSERLQGIWDDMTHPEDTVLHPEGTRRHRRRLSWQMRLGRAAAPRSEPGSVSVPEGSRQCPQVSVH